MIVSFVVIAYNEEKSIKNTLEAIFNLDKLPKAFEVVVVNDGSKDKTLNVVKAFASSHPQLKIVDLQPNQGRGAARAAGVEAAQGNYLAFVDADIILPKNWLTNCMLYMDKYDACGGTAVPDGDVTWVYNTFDLVPRVVPHATTVSGGNGLFKRSVFDQVKFNRSKSDGEDVDLGHQMEALKFKTTNIPGLVVEHRETKNYKTSMRWLYVSGRGASKQFFEHKVVRLPDLAFFGFLATFVLSIAALIISSPFVSTHILLALAVVLAYITGTSVLHLFGKFRLIKTPFKSILAVLSTNSLLAAYYLGRITALFNNRPKQIRAKKVMVYFDYESIYGMPWKNEKYDLTKTTDRLLDVLAKHDVTATFFVVGKIVETHPQVIKSIAKAGHIIGIHGYEHERLNLLSPAETLEFGKKLSVVEDKIEKLTGSRPTSFRSPHLMAPKFYTTELYDLLSNHGYKYVSNREIRFQQEVFHPKRLRVTRWLNKDNSFTKTLNVLLNLPMLATEDTGNGNGPFKLVANIKWLLRGAAPFWRGDMLEVPVYSPLDCDLVGLPLPNVNSEQKLIKYAVDSFVGGLNSSGEFYSLNFHDWIIGTKNRIEIIDQVLEKINETPGASFSNESILYDYNAQSEQPKGARLSEGLNV